MIENRLTGNEKTRQQFMRIARTDNDRKRGFLRAFTETGIHFEECADYFRQMKLKYKESLLLFFKLCQARERQLRNMAPLILARKRHEKWHVVNVGARNHGFSAGINGLPNMAKVRDLRDYNLMSAAKVICGMPNSSSHELVSHSGLTVRISTVGNVSKMNKSIFCANCLNKIKRLEREGYAHCHLGQTPSLHSEYRTGNETAVDWFGNFMVGLELKRLEPYVGNARHNLEYFDHSVSGTNERGATPICARTAIGSIEGKACMFGVYSQSMYFASFKNDAIQKFIMPNPETIVFGLYWPFNSPVKPQLISIAEGFGLPIFDNYFYCLSKRHLIANKDATKIAQELKKTRVEKIDQFKLYETNYTDRYLTTRAIKKDYNELEIDKCIRNENYQCTESGSQ